MIAPLKMLLPKSAVNKFVREPKLDGIEPLKKFDPMFNAVSAVSLDTVSSTGPVKLLLCKSSVFKDVKDDRLVGNGPVKLFRLRSNVSRFSKEDRADGILPLMLLPSKLRLVSTVSLPKSALIWPLKPL